MHRNRKIRQVVNLISYEPVTENYIPYTAPKWLLEESIKDYKLMYND